VLNLEFITEMKNVLRRLVSSKQITRNIHKLSYFVFLC